uniref:Uncharacterized protein n=1 Tax=Panagrolaimus sp. PS1159 TaxID=55785 RepID=A0AC35FZT5_9BILA
MSFFHRLTFFPLSPKKILILSLLKKYKSDTLAALTLICRFQHSRLTVHRFVHAHRTSRPPLIAEEEEDFI